MDHPTPMTPSKFIEVCSRKNFYKDEIEKAPSAQFIVELEDNLLELNQIISIYKAWLQSAINDYYVFITNHRLTTSRGDRRKFSNFMDKYEVKVKKENDVDHYWELEARGKIISTLTINVPDGTSD